MSAPMTLQGTKIRFRRSDSKSKYSCAVSNGSFKAKPIKA